MQVEFKILREGGRVPARAHKHDAGCDLHACETLVLRPGQRGSVGTGIAVAIPKGYAGLVLPRSGLAARHGIALVNSPGLIDAGYRGELRVLLLNTDPAETFTVRPGDRIAQLVIAPLESVEFVESAQLTATARGGDGFGSTGIGG